MASLTTEVLSPTCERSAPQSDHNLVDSQSGSPLVRVARSFTAFEELKEIWNFWCDDPNADLDFYLASARCRHDFVRPHVMIVYRNGRPDCMLVGRLERCRLKMKVGYKTFFGPQVHQLFFLQGGLFGNDSEENIKMLVGELRQSLKGGEADCVELSSVSSNSNLYETSKAEFNVFCRGHFSPLHEHRWLELPASFEEFIRSLPRKYRHEFRRHEKMVVHDFSGRTRIRCYRHEDEVGELAQEVEKISSKTYQRTLGVGFQPESEVLESLRVTARKGGLRGCVLYLGGEPCAYFIGKQYKHAFHGNFMGFDPQFSKYSPGLLVLMHSIEECFDPGYRATQVDLGWGDRQYKRIICNRSRQDGPIYLYALSCRGLTLNFVRSATSFVDFAARKLLAKSSFLQKLKRSWQRRLQEPAVA